MQNRKTQLTQLLFVLVCAQCALSQYIVHTNGSGEGWVDAINNDGIAAGSTTAIGQYFMWTPKSGNIYIGGASPGNGVGGNAGVSDDGTVVSGTMFNAKTSKYEAGLYTVAIDSWMPLGGIGGHSDSSISSGWNISGDGGTIVGLGWEDAGTAYATTWTSNGESTSLGTTILGLSTRANAANFDGTVVAGWQDANIRQGAVWIGGVQERIYLPNGSPASEASSISNDGVWISGMGEGAFWDDAETYRYNTIFNFCEIIPNLTTGAGTYMAGAGMSHDGTTIVGGTWDFGVPAYFGNAFIWREGIGTMHLHEYLDEVGVSRPAGFHFAFASCISPDGSWIAGWGNFGNNIGDTVSFFAHIPTESSCHEDIDESGAVDVGDILIVIDQWGLQNSEADLTGDGLVNVSDLLEVVGNWGPCE